jgi:hypothetical protein
MKKILLILILIFGPSLNNFKLDVTILGSRQIALTMLCCHVSDIMENIIIFKEQIVRMEEFSFLLDRGLVVYWGL